MIYQLLGVNSSILNLLRQQHINWKWRTKTAKGQLNAMRLTGQITTALGNAIVNLLMHTNLLMNNKENINFMLVLGDDNVIGFKNQQPKLDNLGKYIASRFNMQSKYGMSEH